MKLARILAICVLLTALAAPTTAAARWIDFGTADPNAAPDVTLLRSGTSGVSLTVDMFGIEAADVATDLGSFTELRVPGSAFSIETGHPMLPVIREYIEIPQGATPRLSIVRADYREIALSDLGIGHAIVPVQPSVAKIAGAREAARFVIDGDAYAADVFSPGIAASLGEIGQIRAHRFVELEIFAVHYNPASGTIRYLTGIELEITFEGSDWARTEAVLARYASPDFDATARKQFVNAETFAGRGVPALPLGYLIITYDDFYEEIDMLAGLRHRLGYETTVTKLSEIPGGATAANIQAYIIDAYNTWDTPPTFVLLVGDTPQVPPFDGATGSHVSDTYFVCMDGGGEWLPDAFIGRFSCTSEAQVTHLVDKTVKYIRFAVSSGPEWTKKCTFMASSDNYTVSEGTHNYCIDNWVEPAGYTDINKRYCVTYSATTAQCIADINGGISMLTFSGHGSTNGWADGPSMSASQVNALTNVDMLPMVQSYSCITGQFNAACFGETWTNATNGGVLFLGASNSSYWDEDDIMEKAVYDAWFGADITWARGMFNEGLWAVYEAYSGGGRTQYYYEMYTVFGDPALDPWTDIPAEFNVSYQTALPLGQDVFPVDVGTALRDPVEGALVCLYMDGQFYATGLTDASGHVDIAISTPPQDVGTMEVWVSKHDFKPKFGTVNVIVPVTYDINPPTIPISASTPVVVTVWDSAGAPLPDVEITVDGWGIASQTDVTDGVGEAHFTIIPPYGEDLTVVASELSQAYNCFEDVIPVTGASSFTSADIEASVPSIGLFGSLTPHYEGTITGTTEGSAFVVYAVGCGVDASAGPSGGTTQDLFVTPTSAGTITAAIGKESYNVYLEDIAVNVVYGQLAGTVYDAVSAPIVGAAVKGYAAGSDTTGATPLFQDVSGAFGAYDMGVDIDVGYYDVYTSKFGYLTLLDEVFVQYGANVEDFYLDSAPSGVVSGTVTETGTGLPLEATVKVYRSDNGGLYIETTSDPVTGAYSVTLPYFNYQMNVRAYHHIPENRGISVSTPAMTEDFVLDVTLANILVISDGVSKGETFKVDKAGNVIGVMPDVPIKAEKSAAQISTDLVALGYDVTEETAAVTNPATWLPNYDFIVSASGDNISPVASSAYRTALENYVAAGGKLLIEGGEVAYDAVSSPGYASFAANVLHSADWNGDSSGNLTVYDPAHPVTSFPNTIGTITFTYSNYGDQDASIPTADAIRVTSWTEHPSDASIIVYDDNDDPQSGQIVFFQFDYLAGESSGVMALLENTVTYLMAQETPPEGGISGTVLLDGETNHSGVTVALDPGGESTMTDASGYYGLTGLYDGVYTVTATKVDWSSAVVEDISVSGSIVTGIDMMLYPLTIAEGCSTPAVDIPNEDPAGIYDYITFPEGVVISDVEVYIDITHTAIGELVVEVTSPEGTTVRLHNRTGTFADDIVGWYDSELTVDGPGALSDFMGESTQGDWTLFVSDAQGPTYYGTLNEWCVRVIGGAQTGVDYDLGTPVTYVLRGVSPNPFNPMTSVSYGSPTESRVHLAVYSVAGRLVRTLVDREVGPGHHSVVWDGRDNNGVEVGSGVYFCRMEAEGFDDSTKMVLLK